MNEKSHLPEEPLEDDDLAGLPPFVSTWNQLYVIVIAELIGLIGLFYWFTKTFE